MRGAWVARGGVVCGGGGRERTGNVGVVQCVDVRAFLLAAPWQHVPAVRLIWHTELMRDAAEFQPRRRSTDALLVKYRMGRSGGQLLVGDEADDKGVPRGEL